MKQVQNVTNEELVNQIRTGMNVAENMLTLYEQNKGMIYQIAKKYEGMAELEDLAQEGYIGLCKAADGYDPDNGASFFSYAWACIQSHMLRYIRKEKNLPEYLQELIGQYKKLSNAFELRYGRKPLKKEYCQYLSIDREQLRHIEKTLKMEQVASLESPIGEEDLTLSDIVPSDIDIEADVLDEVQQEQLKAILWSLVDSLPDNQGLVIRSRFQDCKTLKETGENIGVTLERVRQIEQKALKELKKNKKVRSFGEEYIAANAMKGTGVGVFNRTWTSATEWVALRLAE